MCSIGARLQRGDASSSICGTTTMDDGLTNTSKQAQAVGSSLATALRDRQAYVIPMQPNRSLPVRPAPHHRPCRTTIVRSSLSRPTSFVITTLQPLVIDAPRTCETAIKQVATSTKKLEKFQEQNNEKSRKEENHKKSKEEEEKHENSKEEKYEKSKEEEKNDELKSKKEESVDETLCDMKRNFGRAGIRDFVTTSDSHLIDISHSPERIDLDMGNDEVTIYAASDEVTSRGCWSEESSFKDKRKRRRKGVKRTIEEAREDFISSYTETGCRTVPPIRLKKIQTLQEPVASCGSSWQGIGREIDSSTFNINAGSMSNAKRFNNHGNCSESAAAKEYSSKYRIVTGHTPPYEEVVDSSSSLESRMESLDAAKLRYRQTKLKVKLRELRRKTVDLGNEMLRTVLTTPRGSRHRQTMNRYEEQIENLEKLLNVLPKAAGYEDEAEDIEWQNYADTTKVIDEQEAEQSHVVSQARTRSSSTSSSLGSSPSLEPPKLSPRSPTNYEAARSPSEVRNSPPVLPRVYVTLADCCEYAWDGRNGTTSRRGRVRRRGRSPAKKEPATELPVISTTTEAILKDKIELIDTSENSNLMEKNFIEVDYNDLDLTSCNSVDVLEVYDAPKSPEVETKDCIERAEEVKPLVKRSSSPQKVAIDTTSVDMDFDAKPHFAEEISELPVENTMEVDSLPIDSACEIAKENEDEKNGDEKKGFVTVRDEPSDEEQSANGLTIDEQFPTLGNWIATLSKKQVAATEAKAKLTEGTPAEDRSSAFQQVFNTDADKPATPEVLQNNTPNVAHKSVLRPQWRSERWQEQQEQQQPLTPSYASSLPMPPPPHPPQLGQEFCSPITMARLYTRNYAIDPYGVAYGYNPAIAAAAATASLWNSAAILQYPLLRPNSALLNSQQSRMQSSNLQFPTGTVSQRPGYRGTQQTAEPKRPGNDSSVNNYGQRDAKLMSAGIPSSYEQAKRANSEYQQAVAAGQGRISCNDANGQAINYRACFQQQQFARAAYVDSAMRLPVPGGTWRSGHVIGAMGTGYNYSGTSGWPATPGSILNSMSRNSTPGFVSSPTVLSMNSSRTRSAKESMDSNLRNCETPHLGKVAYSPNTASNLECSNCGLAGSMFKCLGCEVAFYCDENCQARHWNRHVISCPKKMPKLKKLVH